MRLYIAALPLLEILEPPLGGEGIAHGAADLGVGP
jgi:hypothetical protein